MALQFFTTTHTTTDHCCLTWYAKWKKYGKQKSSKWIRKQPQEHFYLLDKLISCSNQNQKNLNQRNLMIQTWIIDLKYWIMVNLDLICPNLGQIIFFWLTKELKAILMQKIMEILWFVSRPVGNDRRKNRSEHIRPTPKVDGSKKWRIENVGLMMCPKWSS